MKSLFLISNMYPNEKSPGYGCFVKNICDGLSRYGITKKYAAVINGKSESKLQKLCKYLKVYSKIIMYYFRKYDFIYIHYPNQFIPLLYLLRFLKKKNIVVNFHGEDILYGMFGYRKILGTLTESFCRNYATSIIVPSAYYRNVVIQKNLIEKSKIIVSPSGGVDPKIFYPSESHKWTKNHVHLGFVGRLQKDKGIMEFVEICKLLNEKSKLLIEATIIGYGECYELLIDFINQNNLSSKIQIIKGVPQIELGNYYRKMDLFIFNSKRKGESLGLTGLEAMGCGVPVIGSNIGGIATYVKDGYNGWLTPVSDVKAIVERIEEWTSLSIDKKIELRNNSIETAKNYYTDTVNSSLAQSIENVIQKSVCIQPQID